jgi:hypothetical protein
MRRRRIQHLARSLDDLEPSGRRGSASSGPRPTFSAASEVMAFEERSR